MTSTTPETQSHESGFVPSAQNQPLSSSSPNQRRRPHITIRRTSGWKALDLHQIWQFRDLIATFGARDVRLRYRQTALGVVWVILQPLLGAGIFSFVFGKVANLSTDGLPAFIFSYAGLVGWNAFQNTLSKTSSSLVANRQLVSKIFFPRLVLPISTLISTLVDFTVALVMMAILLVIYHIAPGSGLLLFPLWTLLLLLFSLGLGLFAAGLMVSYRDVSHVLPIIIQFLLYASPVAYSVSAVPVRLQWIYRINPLCGILEGIRASLLGLHTYQWGWMAYSAVASILVAILGAYTFKTMERKFADVI